MSARRVPRAKPPWWPGIWIYGPGRFGGIRRNVLPWLGSDGAETVIWCRQTIVIPLLGLGAIIIGLPWHLLSECAPELAEYITPDEAGSAPCATHTPRKTGNPGPGQSPSSPTSTTTSR